MTRHSNSNSNDHDLLIMQDRLMDRISAVNTDIAADFKRFTRIYRNRLLEYRDQIATPSSLTQTSALFDFFQQDSPAEELPVSNTDLNSDLTLETEIAQ